MNYVALSLLVLYHTTEGLKDTVLFLQRIQGPLWGQLPRPAL